MGTIRSEALTLTLAALILFALVPGCAVLLKAEDRAAGYAAKGIKYYCDNTDPAFRERFALKVNADAAPHAAAFTCN